jgi:hypothetical protein
MRHAQLHQSALCKGADYETGRSLDYWISKMLLAEVWLSGIPFSSIRFNLKKRPHMDVNLIIE